MLLAPRGRLYVACANTNEVYVHDADTGAVRERISVALHPKSPPGSTPNALALAPDGSRLYVPNADNNVLAVIAPGAIESRVEGFIPTGCIPRRCRFHPTGGACSSPTEKARAAAPTRAGRSRTGCGLRKPNTRRVFREAR